ncbi:hypothetical protein COU59_01230 [Candidatus Pacearchaeota archaeon CG10_big_fil_rev_8_21_14_0_10_34_12]|nr:MAG: hypothetical protein COU59_01230 [Candidatus Pacearchaeota archaeon CG10_big_fil_rev_8_21_14_0_10_34_12]
MPKKLGKEFFAHSAEKVAKELLGKVLNTNGKRARIVETEAYYGKEDPASKASKGNGDLSKTMAMSPGTILVYGVHNNWLVNFVTGKEGEAEAVLLRALEPLNFEGRCNGPGLLTNVLNIKKNLHKKDLSEIDEIFIEDNEEKFEIQQSFRIGVSKDLPKKLRFYIKGNKHVSKK